MCDDCFGRYAAERFSRLKSTNLLADKADKADELEALELAGAVRCPAPGCMSTPFTAREVALHTSEAQFEEYVKSKTLLPAARQVRDVLRKGAELRALFPNARQCGRCGYGPVEHQACADLTANHGELRGGNVTGERARAPPP